MRLHTALLMLALSGTAHAQAPAPRGAPAAPLALPTGMSPLTQGAYRLSFRTNETALPAGTEPTLAEIGRRLAASTQPGLGRVTVEGHASGPANDVSAARRLSLARANAVRDALVAGGMDATRIDVRALGRTQAALDAADILPPGVTRRTSQTR
jgi:outer membrane protein OmpA-like peptidoglycan-associated protein